MKSSTDTSSLELEELAHSLEPEFAEELLKAKVYGMEDKASVLKLAKKLLVECDYLDEEICTAIDYLQCQVDHLKNQQEVLSALKYQERFTGEFGDLRYIIHQIRDSLMESIRYGKRPREIDEVLSRLGELIKIASQCRDLQPSINFTGIENALSPRCSNCSAPCLSAFRKVQVFLLKLSKKISEKQGLQLQSQRLQLQPPPKRPNSGELEAEKHRNLED